MAARRDDVDPDVDTSDRELAYARVFDAPRRLVFEAWTDPRHLAHWWGPDGFTLTTYEIAPTPGGHWHFVMHGPDGTDYRNHVVFHEVVAPSLLVYEHVPVPDGEPVSFKVTVTFDEVDGRTHLAMRMVFPSREARDWVVNKYGADEGAKQTLARLESHLGTIR
jgi:uncharacterized protein YndB with AHSA1/START domain